MKIAAATTDDLGTLGALERACFAEPWTTATLASALNDDKYLILLARDDGSTLALNAVGYAIGWNVGDEAELARVGVHASARRQGLGKKIADALLESFRERGVKTIFLEVRQSNQAARKLYEKSDFAEIRKRLNYYADGETAIIMKAEL